jgi:hypothetical protein
MTIVPISSSIAIWENGFACRRKVPHYYGLSYNSPCNPPHNKRIVDEEEARSRVRESHFH